MTRGQRRPVYRGAVTTTVSPPTAVRSRRPTVIAVGLVGGICVASALIDPAGGPRLCPFKAMTGLDCPLCGATRAAHQLFRGNVIGALDFNAVFVLAAPVLIWIAVAVLRQGLGDRTARVPHVNRSTVIALVTAVLVFTVVRNLGVAPFNWLSSST